MTEAEWLACGDPTAMLEFVRGRASERQLRLFVCAVCRRHAAQVAMERFTEAVETSEQYADGLLSREELAVAAVKPWHASLRLNRVQQHASCIVYSLCWSTNPMYEAAMVTLQGFNCKKQSIQRGRARLVRDIFGNPFRPVTVEPSWRTSTVVALARQMYASRDFSPMPILDDALQDAGCDNPDVLDHCRGPGPHVRGCWVVDLLLGKG